MKGMGLVVYWYDCICLGIVGVALFGSLFVLWKREGQDRSAYQYRSLLDAEGNTGGCGCDVTVSGHVSSSQLWTSCWRGLHPLCLLALRFVSCAIMAVLLAFDILTYHTSIFIYYTEWTSTLVIIYFAIATIVSAHGCMAYYSKKPPSPGGERGEFPKTHVEEYISASVVTFTGNQKLQSHINQEAALKRAGFWGYLMQAAYQTCAGAVVLTDLVFWCIIVPFLTNAHLKLNMLMGCMHTLNAVFLLLDTAVNNLPFPWFRLAYFVLWSCSYVIFQWFIHACGFSWWPYPFLELSTPWAPVWYLCLALVHIPCYGLYSLLAQAKNTIFSRLFPHAFIRTP